MAEEKQGASKEPPKPADRWTPEMVNAVLGGITPRVKEFWDRYISLKEREFDHEIRMENAIAKADWSVLSIFLGFLALVVALMVWLTLAGRVSGDALLFLVDTISG